MLILQILVPNQIKRDNLMAKTKVINYGKAIKYEVSCRPNNSVDIQCGGLVSISFDFYVNEKKTRRRNYSIYKKRA